MIDCWHKIGVIGDKTCPQLKTVIHCRNCAVYSTAGRALFEREPPQGYWEEWTDLLAQPLSEKQIKFPVSKQDKTGQDSAISVIVFRLEEEWFALPIWVIKEVTSLHPIHTLPHRSNNVLRGIVNIRGEILTCISLTNVLGLLAHKQSKQNSKRKIRMSPVIYQRMIVMEIQDNRWVFQVDELESIERFCAEDFHDAPTAIAKIPDNYTKKIITFADKNVNFLDHELLFYELLFYTYSRPQ